MVTDTETGAASAQETEQSPADGSSTRERKFRISAERITLATAEMPERERIALRWAHSLCINKNISYAELATKLKQPTGEPYHADSLYQAFTGRREVAQLGNIVDAIERFRRIEEERGVQVDSGYIHDSLGKRIWRICRRALLRQRVAFIWGETQIGKTDSIFAYLAVPEHNHGQTKYFRFPAGGSYSEVLVEMARMLGIPSYHRGPTLRRAIIDSFDEHMLLIVDEIMESQGDPSGSVKRNLRTLNFLREIQDLKKCGMVLIGTNVFRDTITHCREARNLRQLLLRGLPPLQLPSVKSKADLKLFAKAFGLGQAPDDTIEVRVTLTDGDGDEKQETLKVNPLTLQTQVNEQFGFGRWKLILQEASDLAREARRPITWGAVVKAWRSFEGDVS